MLNYLNSKTGNFTVDCVQRLYNGQKRLGRKIHLRYVFGFS